MSVLKLWCVFVTNAISGLTEGNALCVELQLEKDRDGCPKIINIGASRTDLFYEKRRQLGFKRG
ncbi:hypothetical protein H0H92_008127 [Tricholoma furcatifolium]|nr:hypothetical protein H0H92_008127 [Tricholoma furcatifolium]